ncbi:unnamed protein product [Cunninghamella echinulata]
MALFANDIDLKTTINKKTPSLAYVNFVASAASTKLLGQFGHLALSAPSQIIGRFQFLKTIRHPHLCSYIDIHRGKNDRLFVVSEYFDYSLQKSKGSSISINGASDLDISFLQKMACQILSALNYLHELGIIHCCLCPNLILFDPEHNIKLFGYGLNYMTGNGIDIDFPIGYPQYLSPEYTIDPIRNRTMKSDIWSLGIILLEEYTHQSFWTTSDLGLIFDSLTTLASLMTTKGNTWLHKDVESLDINEHVLYFLKHGTLHNNNNKQYEAQRNDDTTEDRKSTNQSTDQHTEESFHQFILSCLQVNPTKRLDAHALLSSPFLSEFIKKSTSLSIENNYWVPGPLLSSDDLDDMDGDIEDSTSSPHEKESPKKVLDRLPISQVYHLWKLAGGDVELDAAKKDVFSVTPVIERLPRVCDLKENIEIGTTTRDSSQLYSDTVYKLEFKELYLRLDEGQKNKESKQPDRFEWDTDFFMVVEDDDVNFLLDGDSDDERKKRKKEKTHNNNDDDKLEIKLEDEFIYTDESNNSQQQQQQQQQQNDNNNNITKNDHVLSPISMSRQTSNLSNSSTPPPTTPSRPNRRTLSFTSLTRSDSISSLPPSSPTGNGSMSLPITSLTSGSLSSMNGSDINHYNNNNGNNKLPLFLREQDSNYQFQRQLLFSKLLQQYPASRKELIHQAKIDIPPLFRGKVWAAILGVQGDIQHTYNNIDKFIDIGADRQIEMDVPRCHQYNQLLASSVGHEKLKRLLKAWVFANPNCVYWQGLDSLCAPFLTLLFNDEAMAFACLQLFIPKLLNNFFLSDNSRVLQEYLAVFRHLLSYHDPELSSHLDSIGINPDLYAISWFLTLFTHVFSLDKIYHLWDKFLVGPSSLPLFAGIAILRQIRDVLLTREFNDCIVLINDIPKIDIEKCVQHAMSMCKVTPLSVSTRIHDENDKFYTNGCETKQGNNSNNNNETSVKKIDINDKYMNQQQPWWERPISLETKKKELAPRINSDDLYRILPYCLILDIRSDQDFPQHHIPSSMNVQIKQLPSYANVLKKLNRKYYVVFADKEDEGAEFATQLVNRHFPRVALLQSGIESLKRIDKFNGLCNCRPQKQTTAGHKGKGSEPPFVIWRCKSQLSIEKK